jgi:hypothetical protein
MKAETKFCFSEPACVHENALKEGLQKHACSMTGGAQPRWVLPHHVDDIAAQPMQRRILRSSKTNLTWFLQSRVRVSSFEVSL